MVIISRGWANSRGGEVARRGSQNEKSFAASLRNKERNQDRLIKSLSRDRSAPPPAAPANSGQTITPRKRDVIDNIMPPPDLACLLCIHYVPLKEEKWPVRGRRAIGPRDPQERRGEIEDRWNEIERFVRTGWETDNGLPALALMSGLDRSTTQ